MDGLFVSEAGRKLFAEVVLPHLDSAHRLARGLTGNAADAEDVVQDACLRALKGIDGYSGGNARAWLLAITRNAAFTFLARHRSRSLVMSADAEEAERAMEYAPDPGAGAEASLIAQADAAAIERALAALPAPFREIVILREYNDLSYREIAEVIRAPIGTVMSRLARARALLLAALAPDAIRKTAS